MTATSTTSATLVAVTTTHFITFVNAFFLGKTGKNRTIRFADDDSWNPDADEKDTRIKFKPAVSPLVAKMLRMAGQDVPMIKVSITSCIDNGFVWINQLINTR